MKNKFIRIISPISLAMALLLNIAVVYFIIYAYRNFIEKQSAVNILFAVISVLSLFLAIFYSREVTRHGIKFTENEFEITFLDNNNSFKYSDIKAVETDKDTKASLKKNFVDRYSRLTIILKDGTQTTTELGLTTKKKLNKIENEINLRIRNNGE